MQTISLLSNDVIIITDKMCVHWIANVVFYGIILFMQIILLFSQDIWLQTCECIIKNLTKSRELEHIGMSGCLRAQNAQKSESEGVLYCLLAWFHDYNENCKLIFYFIYISSDAWKCLYSSSVLSLLSSIIIWK